MLAGVEGDHDVKDKVAVRNIDFNGSLIKEFAYFLFLRLRNVRDDLEHALGIACDYAGRRCGRYAAEPVRVGDDNALDVLDDVAARLHLHALNAAAAMIPSDACAVCNRNRLGAAHCREQLLMQYFYAILIFSVCSFHFSPPETVLLFAGLFLLSLAK